MRKEDIILIKRNLHRASYYRCLPVKWDSKTGNIVLQDTKSRKVVIFTLLVNLAICFCRIFTTFAHSSSLIDKAEAGIGAVMYSIGFILRFDLPIDHDIVKFVVFLILHPNEKFGMI